MQDLMRPWLWIVGAVCVAVGCSSTRPSGDADLADDPNVVAVYAGQALTLDEFEERYARAVGGREAAADDSLAEYEDFLRRYVEFRLKVLEARHLGLDRDSSIVAEINTYRTGLARPYLLEQEVLEPIIRDLYDRSRYNVDASHILIRVDEGAPPADTLEAYNTLVALRDSIELGADFGDLAARYSQDPSAQRPQGAGARGRLGFFGSGQMVPAFEAAAFRTPAGELSEIVRTPYGYHLIYVHDRAEARPDLKVAHIMIVPDGPTAPDTAAVMTLLDQIQERLAEGADFGALAQQFSEDARSARDGGELPYLNPLQPMPQAPSFKEAVLGLEAPGDVSGVVQTPFGFHLIKLVEERPVPSYDEAYADLKTRAARSPEAEAAQRALSLRLREQYGAALDTTALLGAFSDLPTTDTLVAALRRGALPSLQGPTVLATLGDSTYTVADLAATATAAQTTLDPSTDRDQLLLDLADAMLDEKAIAYEMALLETRDDEFGRIMQEFRDGLVLFRLMQDDVWDAAAQDTAALEAYFQERADEYRFPERTQLVGFYGPRDTLTARVVTPLSAGTDAAALATALVSDTLTTVRVDTTYLAAPTGSFYDQALDLEPGAATDVLRYQGGHVVLVNAGRMEARPKTFEEALPRLITDYQSVLEEEMLSRLRREHDARLFPGRLDRAFEDRSPSAATPTAAVNGPQ